MIGRGSVQGKARFMGDWTGFYAAEPLVRPTGVPEVSSDVAGIVTSPIATVINGWVLLVEILRRCAN